MSLPFFVCSVGRRKMALSTLDLRAGSRRVRVNGYCVEDFFSSCRNDLSQIKSPFRALDRLVFDAKAKIQGGGFSGRAKSLQLALARAISVVQPGARKLFAEHYLLTCDDRKKERRKYGLKKSRKAPQFSKRSHDLHFFDKTSLETFTRIIFTMSQTTDVIIEQLKTLTLLEAAELVSQIEETFGVDAHAPTGGVATISLVGGADDSSQQKKEEKTTFNVVLESIREDKRVSVLKVIRSLTSFGLKEAKDFCSSLPKVVKEGVSREDAEMAKKDLEVAGRGVTIT
jgi:large subunit ribosomal protein L7/L12